MKITAEQREIILANMGQMKNNELAALAGVPVSFVSRVKHAASKKAENLIKHEHQETMEEKRARVLQYIRAHKKDMTALEMATALGIPLTKIEDLAFQVLHITLIGVTTFRYGATQPIPIQRAKGEYSNKFASPIADEYWQEENKSNPIKRKPLPEDD